ncbi:peptidoglycan-binding protein [Streptomyces sp. SL13]|uniref:Peptidoglycan-binding protein n=1 Tax=Streptantibioticus silvisoli TaxID=2705255 RepID=A0AA90K8G0_9ACTN|nr:peptidoglycan-binding protein [Streptantibioticus silvisoli]MDI5969402.1 peptidoglycan-binding protein [Streptantibioticus silvisoli]
MADVPLASPEPQNQTPPGGAGLVRRRRFLGATVATAVAVSGLTLGASRFVKSPAQAAADTAAPPPSVMTAPVEDRVLKDSVILRGTVSASQTVEITPSGAGQDDAGPPVVTKINLTAGQTFGPARVLMEVSGRPVIALKGRLPVYRSLEPGAEGDDVAQLQQALRDTGRSVGSDRTGLFGPGTKSALAGLYRSIGYDPLPAVPSGGDTVADAQDAVTAAQRHLQDVQSTGGTSADGDTNAMSGDRALDISRASEDLAQAEKRLAGVTARSGPMLPASEVVYLQSFPARVEKVGATVGSQVTGSVMTVSAGRLVVTGVLTGQQRTLVRPGQQVQILSEVDGTTAGATVRTISDTVTGTQDDGNQDGSSAPADGTSQGYVVTVEPVKPLSASLAGQDVRLTIQAAATKSKVLVVPVTAISAGADGATAVTVAGAGGRVRRVPVTTGASGDGYVEVRPVPPARLAAGEKVVTGAAGTDSGTTQ